MAASAGSHLRQGSTGSATAQYPTAPASPTLTNPDMILPDYDYADYEPLSGYNSRNGSGKNAAQADLNFHVPRHNNYAPAAPINPTTPILYGNGTMLSDIGEVTEAESTIGPSSRRGSRYSALSDEEAFLQPAPRIIKGTMITSNIAARGRRASVDSTSTITTQDQNGHFGDFDDMASVGDSSFQGDDEESMASSYVDDGYHQQGVTRAERLAPPNGGQPYVTSAISMRAEQILANAKKRLTKMEGNLSRARTSLSISSISDSSTPSPPMVRPATALRESPPTSHSRNNSDNSVNGGPRPALQPRRAASALGAAGGYRQPSSSLRKSDGADGIAQHPLGTSLQPLGEDDDDSCSEAREERMQRSELVSPAMTLYSDAGLVRSASVAQMRDLQDQMSGLKGKISSLREQARADSMKRRSLQSLRTPSPFTHATWEQGYKDLRSLATPDPQAPHVGVLEEAGPVEDDDKTPVNEAPMPIEVQVEKAEVPEAQGANQDEASADGDGDGEASDPESVVQVKKVEQEDDLQTQNGDLSDNEAEFQEAASSQGSASPSERSIATDLDDQVSESGESIYHETYVNPVSHEDREDAFDYEHFFLHSAMGTLSRQRAGRRGSVDSHSSEASVETTRGPPVSSTHIRRPSVDTMSSMQSFATANENLASRSTTAQSGVISPVTAIPAEDEQRLGSAFGSYASDSRPGASFANRPITRGVSISSFESTGTNRSFPLVNKPRMNGGVLTPGGSPDHDLKRVSESLMSETLRQSPQESLENLAKEDMALVSRLVATLGKRVLDLESAEADTHRRRIERAIRALEGQGDAQ